MYSLGWTSFGCFKHNQFWSCVHCETTIGQYAKITKFSLKSVDTKFCSSRVIYKNLLGITHLVPTQTFPKSQHFFPMIRTHTCAFQEVGNVRFSKSFAYALNGWSLTPFYMTKQLSSAKNT